MGIGVTDVVTSSQARQGWFAAGAAHADVAMASTVKAPFLKVHGDDRTWAIACMGAPVFVIQGIGFGLDNMVNYVSPNVRGVTAQYYLTRFFTFRNLIASIREWPQCIRNIRVSR